MKKLLFVFPIVALLAAGCNSASQSVSQQPTTPISNSQTPTTQNSENAVINTSNWLNFSNKSYGYSFSYPSNLQPNYSLYNDVTLQSSTNPEFFRILVAKNKTNLPLATLLVNLDQANDSSSLPYKIVNSTQITVDGLLATQREEILAPDNTPDITTYVSANGYLFLIITYPENSSYGKDPGTFDLKNPPKSTPISDSQKAIYEQILATIKFSSLGNSSAINQAPSSTAQSQPNNNVRNTSPLRDEDRVAMVHQITDVLDLFQNTDSSGNYPSGNNISIGGLHLCSPGGWLAVCQSGQNDMFITMPAPTPPDGVCTTSQNNYTYTQTQNGKGFNLTYCVGAQTGGINPGQHTVTEKGSLNN